MTPTHELRAKPPATERAAGSPEAAGPKFARNNDFQSEVRRRVDEFFRSTGRRRRDVPQMYFKTAIVLVAFAVFYIALVWTPIR